MDCSAYIIAGPTATGKTDVAHAVAASREWGVLSADSMLVYRGMDIGTAKPSQEMMREIPYGGVDLVEPGEEFNAGLYVQHVSNFIKSHRHLMIAGGTGLYIRSLTNGLDLMPSAHSVLRKEAEAYVKELGVEALSAYLREHYPTVFQTVQDPHNPRRLIRAYELAKQGYTGHRVQERCLKARMIGLDMERAMHHKKIEMRVHYMYESGLLEETETLLKKNEVLSSTALQAIGYREAAAVLKGSISRHEAIDKTVLRTRQLAKRQRTWFRNQASVHWIFIEMGQPLEHIVLAVEAIMKKYGPTKLRI